MTQKLKVLATPIGNLRDISLRAMDELKGADLVLAEDTRNFKKLISCLGLELKSTCKIISCDSHKEKERAHIAIERLKANDSVVLVSDAGCPGISDPGSWLVQMVVDEGLEVEIVPGPSALTAAIMGAGIDMTRFAFLGFLPQKKSARKQMVQSAFHSSLSLVIYESAIRLPALLKDLADSLGDARIVVARELTKVFESFHRGRLGQPINPPIVFKGECVILVEAVKNLEKPKPDSEVLGKFIAEKKAQKLSNKDIAALLVQEYSLPKNLAYKLVLKEKA